MVAHSLSRPTLLQIITGTVVTLARDSFKLKNPDIPQQIEKYSLVTSIKKQRGYNYSYAIGVYTWNQKKYFIKQWTGKVYDLNYYSLINEFRIAKFFSENISTFHTFSIQTPSIVEYIQTPTSFALVYEYIPGDLLSTYPLTKRSEVLFSAIEALSTLSKQLEETDLEVFSKRSDFFTFISFFPLASAVIIFNWTHRNLLIKQFVGALRSYVHRSTKRSLVIAHRDLDASNILVSGTQAYLIDFESVVLTNSDYDVVRLMTTPDVDMVPEKYAGLLKRPENIFLITYILFHLIISAQAAADIRNSYIKQLQKLVL